MRLLITLFLFIIACCQAFGAGVPSPATPRLQIDADGTLISADNPLPVNAFVTIGSATVDPAAPVAENLTTIVSAVASAQSVASLANRKSVAFINQSASVMGWISLDSAVASAAVGIGIPLPPYGFFSTELDSAKIVGVAADGVASITVYQDGY